MSDMFRGGMTVELDAAEWMALRLRGDQYRRRALCLREQSRRYRGLHRKAARKVMMVGFRLAEEKRYSVGIGTRAMSEMARAEAATAVGVLALSASATWAERAAQLGLELEAALKVLGETRRSHWEDDERCCPKVYEPDEVCNCGADEWNAKVDAMLAAWQAKAAAGATPAVTANQSAS